MATATDNQVAQDLATKLQLEAILRPKVNRLFQRMVNAHGASVRITGLALNAQAFNPEWEKLLFEHYRRTQDAFKGSVAAFQVKALTNWYLTKQGEFITPTSEGLLGGALLLWAERQAPSQAQFITNTNMNNIADAMAKARELLLEEDSSLDNRSMSRASSAILKRDMQGRTGSIIMTETQSAAEGAKSLEAHSLSGIDPRTALEGVVPAVTTTQQWQTVGDKRVRQAHRNANRQIRPLGVPFEVGGEFLRFPGDSSLGASVSNTANCRCSAVYRL